ELEQPVEHAAGPGAVLVLVRDQPVERTAERLPSLRRSERARHVDVLGRGGRGQQRAEEDGRSHGCPSFFSFSSLSFPSPFSFSFFFAAFSALRISSSSSCSALTMAIFFSRPCLVRACSASTRPFSAARLDFSSSRSFVTRSKPSVSLSWRSARSSPRLACS